MFEHLLKVRYLVVVIVLLAVLHSVAFLLMGAQTAFAAYKHVLGASASGDTARPGVEILHSLDLLLLSMVLVVLALGFAKLFLLAPSAKVSAELPAWLHVESISELKALLWEAILTTLLIVALSKLSESLFTTTNWTVLLTPAAILLLSLSLYFMKKE